jgi:hypothetical protein
MAARRIDKVTTNKMITSTDAAIGVKAMTKGTCEHEVLLDDECAACDEERLGESMNQVFVESKAS